MFKKILLYFNYIVLIVLIGLTPASYNFTNAKTTYNQNCPKEFFSKFISLFSSNTSEVANTPIERRNVYISGKPMGFMLDGGGVVVVSMGEIKVGENFVVSPCEKAGIKAGDVIVSAEQQKVTSGERLIDIVNKKRGGECELEVLRNNETLIIKITPLYDDIALSYRLGVWVRDNAVGVGTVTYVTQDNKFSALGHPVSDSDTGTIMPIGEGKVYKCSVVGVKKGERGNPGELKGLFLKGANTIGSISSNSKLGIQGSFNSEEIANQFKSSELYEVAFASDVTPGSAKIYTTIDGATPEYYNIEIVKTNHINSEGQKCMVIKITDENLLQKTNGIVQGMSGSPIIQNGRLVGCVTHVFINDPTKGFAEFIK